MCIYTYTHIHSLSLSLYINVYDSGITFIKRKIKSHLYKGLEWKDSGCLGWVLIIYILNSL